MSFPPTSTKGSADSNPVTTFEIDFPNNAITHTGTKASIGVTQIAGGGTNNGSLAVTAGGVLYTDGSKVVNVGAGSSGNILQSNGASAPTWVAAPGSTSASFELVNLGIATSVATNALTVALKQADGTTDPSSGGAAVKIGFRSATAATGGYSEVSVTGALSLTVASGATLGTANNVNYWLYVYAINNAGTAELAISANLFDDGSIVSTTALSGSSNSINVLYSTTARSNVPVRLIGRMKISESTAGTWASNATEVSVAPFSTGSIASQFAGLMRLESALITITGATTGTVTSQSGNWISSISVSGTIATLTLISGTFSATPFTVVSLAADTSHARFIGTNASSATSVAVVLYDTNGIAQTGAFNIFCMGPR